MIMKKDLEHSALATRRLKQINLKIMLNLLSVFFIAFQASARTGSSTTIELDYENVPLKRILKDIKAQTNYSFFYNVKEIDDTKKISFRANNEAIDQV